MLYVLLVVIYISFISLGLPDSVLGSAWPVMYQELKVPLSYSGIIFIIITLGTVISSLSSERVIHKFGTGKTTFISVMLTAIGMLGFSFSHLFILLCFCAIPYGLGAGSVDTALNNYVALHYESKHMSWLHCMWGLGASIGPIIMSTVLKYDRTWSFGYRCIAFLQFGLCFILFLSLPLWNKKSAKKTVKQIEKEEEKTKTEEIIEINSLNNNNNNEKNEENTEPSKNESNSSQKIDINDKELNNNSTNDLIIKEQKNSNLNSNDENKMSIYIKEIEKKEEEEEESKPKVLGLRRTIKLPGAKEAMIFFFCHCAIEQTIGLWASSFLVLERGLPEVTAARFGSLFYIGITLGRATSGFITLKLNDNQMIVLGESIIILGIVMILLPFGYWFTLIGFIMSGLGCAPLYPCMIHATPTNFGKDKSQAVIGVQMASGSMGVLLMPPLYGLLSKWMGLKILPFYLGIILVVMIFTHYKVVKITKK